MQEWNLFEIFYLHRRTKDGWTPLHSAANWGNYHVVGRLISHGVDVNAVSSGSVTVKFSIMFECFFIGNILHLGTPSCNM